MIELEDFSEDIIGKAMRGLAITPPQLSALSGVGEQHIKALLEGNFNEQAARAIAPHLALSADALVASAQSMWRPDPVEIEGLEIFNTPWRDMRVNAFVLWDPGSGQAAAFDTGADAGAMIDFLEKKSLTLGAVYLTHTHGDHIADLDRLLDTFSQPPVYVSEHEPLQGTIAIAAGHSARIGGLTLETRLTHGHSRGGHTYVVTGLARPIAIVGDALFAGSMGGGMVSYSDALETNRQQIFTLADNTVVCPGHGPMSSVGEEKQHNPFYPEFKTN
ncbi:MAG: MBL fold metallo-hydrolase [Verrucomicrobiales bacterium]|nr:MBL fold metallo-hydrolase [Verrucomicrobiales bacterium]